MDREAAGVRSGEEVPGDPPDPRRAAHRVRRRVLPRVPADGRAGYVVLYTNPRGSSTYGQEFGNIIQDQYPGDDHQNHGRVDHVMARLRRPKNGSASPAAAAADCSPTGRSRRPTASTPRSRSAASGVDESFWYTRGLPCSRRRGSARRRSRTRRTSRALAGRLRREDRDAADGRSTARRTGARRSPRARSS